MRSRINSPDELNEIIHVTNPGVWIILTALFVLLLGALCWGIFGRLETTIPVTFTSQNGEVTARVSYEEGQAITIGSPIRTNHFYGEVIDTRFDEERNEEIIIVNISFPDIYTLYGEIVTEYIHPIEFLFR